MFGSIGMPELIIIFIIALIIFGPRKLPELGRSLGRSLTEFKRASNDLRSTLEEEIRVEDQRPEPFSFARISANDFVGLGQSVFSVISLVDKNFDAGGQVLADFFDRHHVFDDQIRFTLSLSIEPTLDQDDGIGLNQMPLIGVFRWPLNAANCTVHIFQVKHHIPGRCIGIADPIDMRMLDRGNHSAHRDAIPVTTAVQL